MWIESAHLFDAPLTGAADLAARLGPPRAEGVGRVAVPLTLEIPFAQVASTPRGSGHEVSLELRVAATDADGRRADLPVVPVLLSREKEPEAGATGTYETSLRLRRRPHRLLISLYDPATGKLWARRIDFAP